MEYDGKDMQYIIIGKSVKNGLIYYWSDYFTAVCYMIYLFIIFKWTLYICSMWFINTFKMFVPFETI